MPNEHPFAQPHEYWMRFAFQEAEKAFDEDEVPIGCVIVKDNAIIGRGHNQTEQFHDASAHAEMIAITAACSTIESKFLTDATLYVTLEPCPMCAGAIVLARLENIVFGSYDPKAGACGTLFTITEDKRLNHQVHTIGGVMDIDCSTILKEYFKKKR
jgi:tRNA(adenine34) deaminase